MIKNTDNKGGLPATINFNDILKLLSEYGEDKLDTDNISAVIEKLFQVQEERKSKANKNSAKGSRKTAKQKALELENKRKEEARRAEEEKHIAEVTSMELPMDWENLFAGDGRVQGVHIESIPDALIKSLTTLGKVDIEYISSVTGADCREVITALKGSIYQNPETWGECFFKGWETADEYLSGNLKRKWQIADSANKKYKGYFDANLSAIESVMPSSVASNDIFVTLGSPWIPADIIDNFIEHLFGDISDIYYFSEYECEYFKTIHDEYTGSWEIPEKSRYGHSHLVRSIYGTDRIEALHILERTLNMKSVTVTDEVDCSTNKSGKKRVINRDETLLAIEKQQKLIREFQDWIWTDPDRKKRLQEIFDDKFACIRRRVFDGSFLEFPNMSDEEQLYPYQKNAVARMLFTPNTLLAHDVGSGKTYEMIAAGMEMRRMGISEKNLYVVPNNIIGQWELLFRQLYPSANLLIVDRKTFISKKRKQTLEMIRDEDFDAVIITYSCFTDIPLSPQFYIDQLIEIQDKLEEITWDRRRFTKKVRSKVEKIREKLFDLTKAIKNIEDAVFFDELGITRLFVDEAHNFKNIPIESMTDNVLGISKSGSSKCRDMLDKVRFVQKSGGGVVMATGTPITNSITDVYVIQKYLQNGELALLDLESFDSWLGMFAQKNQEFEVDVDTTNYRMATRFSKFHNLPELTLLLSQIADFHKLDKSNGLPDFDGYSDAVISKTEDFSEYLEEISKRADIVRHGGVERTIDNMLKITTDGRKAALDLRLVMPNSGFTYNSKAVRCAENALNIYRTTDKTQVIFCDSSTPKEGFNMYDELKRLLCAMGVPSEEIAFVHDAQNEKQRKDILDKFRKGTLRIMIGSTSKLGTGTNIQDKLYAVHHLDVPWRPSDMTQREGRILRQGNENSSVKIFRYITEGSFDAYSWQLLETKQRFINDLLSGSYSERESSDIDDTALNYAEVKALAVGNPLVRLRVETSNELSRCRSLQRKTIEKRLQMEKELQELPGRIAHQGTLIEKAMKDEMFYKKYMRELHEPVTQAERNADSAQRKELRERIFAAVSDNAMNSTERLLIEYRGFKVILPANMTKEKPFVWLQRRGRYYVELGDTEAGVLVRINNFLDKLGDHIKKLGAKQADLTERSSQIRQELSIKDGYTDEIARLQAEIDRIDRELEDNIA